MYHQMKMLDMIWQATTLTVKNVLSLRNKRTNYSFPADPNEK
jgi:hypothetical protein